jgi:tripartite-type tricarboxylate transporter receptor subunit TctC
MTKLLRRQFLQLAGGAAVLPAVSRIASAQAYPSRPVRLIVPVPPGGALDIIARLMGQWLSEKLGQSFIIENRPGGGTNIGVEAVVRAPADGYTLLLVPGSVTANATLYPKLNFDFIRDIIPIALISELPLVMEVNPSFPAKTVPEFIAYAKANPGKISMASGGTGSTSHIGGELLKLRTGIDMLHVPYRGGAPAVTDLLGGQVQVYFSPLPESIETIKAGKVRALAVTTAKRSEALPDLHRRVGSGLRSQHLARHRRAQGHPCRDRRAAQLGDQCRSRRPRHQEASRRSRQHAAADVAGRLQEDDRRGNREVGQGDPRRVGKRPGGAVIHHAVEQADDGDVPRDGGQRCAFAHPTAGEPFYGLLA